jgi:hypothetical protein
LLRVISSGLTTGSSLSSKISASLSDYRFTDALVYLFEMYTRRIPPKLGAIQRWVRECDATSGADGTPGDKEALKCLDLILRIANMGKEDAEAESALTTTSTSNGESSGSSKNAGNTAVVRRKKSWVAREKSGNELQIWKAIKEGSFSELGSSATGIYDPDPGKVRGLSILTTATQTDCGHHPSFRKVHFLPGASRRPPNVYDSTVYASSPGAIALTPSSSRAQPTKVDVPGVSGAFIVLDVFTPEECRQIVKAAVDIGFEKDEAATGSARMKTSVGIRKQTAEVGYNTDLRSSRGTSSGWQISPS